MPVVTEPGENLSTMWQVPTQQPGSFLPYKLRAQPLGTDPGWSKSVMAVTFPLARNWSKMEIYVCETHVRPMRWMRCKGKCTRDSRKDIPLQLRQRERADRRIPCLPPWLLFYFRYHLWEYDAWKWSSHPETMRQVWRRKVLTDSMPKMLEGWKEPGDLIKITEQLSQAQDHLPPNSFLRKHSLLLSLDLTSQSFCYLHYSCIHYLQLQNPESILSDSYYFH